MDLPDSYTLKPNAIPAYFDAILDEKSLSFDFLDPEFLAEGQRMSVVYAAVHAFENTVRTMVTKASRKTSKTRMEEDAKFRWHGARGASEINYCDFGDLSSVIVTNWEVF